MARQKAKVYIGEAENAYSRLVDHVSKKEFWNEIIVQVDDKLVFKSDWLFSSPSAAANVIMGRSANGLKEWILPAKSYMKLRSKKYQKLTNKFSQQLNAIA
jgi:hypothetical protein